MQEPGHGTWVVCSSPAGMSLNPAPVQFSLDRWSLSLSLWQPGTEATAPWWRRKRRKESRMLKEILMKSRCLWVWGEPQPGLNPVSVQAVWQTAAAAAGSEIRLLVFSWVFIYTRCPGKLHQGCDVGFNYQENQSSCCSHHRTDNWRLWSSRQEANDPEMFLFILLLVPADLSSCFSLRKSY